MSASSKTQLHKVTPAMYVMQAVCYAAFAAIIGFLSSNPSYTAVDEDQALIKLSLSHPGENVTPCVKVKRSEMAKEKSITRKTKICSRERHPVVLALSLNGEELYREVKAPRGLKNDGPSSFYEKFIVPAGKHRLSIGINKHGQSDKWDFTFDQEVTIEPGQNLVIGFRDHDETIIVR